VLAAADGKVTETGSSASWGNYLRFKTNDGRVVIYAHLEKVLVNKNDSIKTGDVVAYSGNTGASTGPHLHFGIYEQGKSVDPLKVLSEDTKESDNKLILKNGE